MTLEKKLTEVVESANRMTQTVTEKQSGIDQKVNEMESKVNEHIQSMDSRLTRICITKNPQLAIDPETNLPESFSLNSEVSTELVTHISADPAVRTAEQLAILTEMEQGTGLDLRKSAHYRNGFNILKLSWSTTGASNWLAFPQARHGAVSVSSQTTITVGAFVKILSGSISGYWGNNAVVGEWKFCSGVIEGSNHFGHYFHPHPLRLSQAGELLVALPAVCTGSALSGSSWFPLVEL